MAGARRRFESLGRTDPNTTIDTVYGDWEQLREMLPIQQAPKRLDSEMRAGLRIAAEGPAALLDLAHEAAAMALMACDGDGLDELARLADQLRADVVRPDITYVVNRNINFSNICYVGCRFCSGRDRTGTDWPTAGRAASSARSWTTPATPATRSSGARFGTKPSSISRTSLPGT